VCACARVCVCVNTFMAFECAMDIALRRGPRLKLVKMKTRPELVLHAVNATVVSLEMIHLENCLFFLRFTMEFNQSD
jgi:hypothetical protein